MFKEYSIRFGLVVFGGCLGLILLEIVLRLFLPSNTFMVLTPNMSQSYEFPYRQLPGVQKSVLIETNEMGFKGKNAIPSEGFGILAIGGSTTESNSVNLEDSWPKLLENELNSENRNEETFIINVGKSGLNSGHHVLQMKYLLQQMQNIDMVLMLVGINDFNRRLLLGKNYFTTKNDETLMKRAFSMYPRQLSQVWHEKTELWLRLRQMNSIWKRSEMRDSEHYDSLIQQFRSDYLQKEKTDTLPDLTIALQDYKDNLLEISNIAKMNHVSLVWITQPTLWGKDLVGDLEVYGATHLRSPDGYAYSISSLENGVNRFNQILLDVAHQEGVDIIDLAAVLPKDTTVFYDYCHYNRNGMKEIANILNDSLSVLMTIH